MKINTIVADVESNINFSKSTTMTVDADALEHIMGILTNLYSNVEAAVFREVLSNAIDSHVASGQTRQIEVTLPSRMSPNFIVKDFGTGMSEETLNNTFSKYGASTKRGSNAEMGGFGLGAKAPFALTSRFTIYSIHNGIKHTVIASLNEQNIGTLNFVASVPTTDSNGVEVSIPVDNIARFNAEAPNILLACDPKMVMVDGQPITGSIYNTENWVDVDGTGWFNVKDFLGKGTSYTGRPKVKIGSVVYDITEDSVLNVWSRDVAAKVGRLAVVSMEIGEVDLVPSRDNLKYSSRTIKAIQAAYKRYVDALHPKINEIMQELDSRHDVLRFHYYATQIGFKIENVWNGEKIDVKISNEDKKIAMISTADRRRTSTDFPRELDLSNMSVSSYGQKPALVFYNDIVELNRLSKEIKDYMKFSKVNSTSFIAIPAGEKVSVWMEGLAEVLTVKDISEKALEHRRSLRKLNSNAGTGARTAVSYFTADLVNYAKDSYSNRSVPKIELKDISDAPYYISSEAHNMGNLTENVKMQNHTADFFKALVRLGLSGEVVIIPASLSLERFLKLRPNAVDIKTVLSGKVNKVIKALTVEEKAFLYGNLTNKQHGIVNFARYLNSHNAVESITNETTRSFIRLSLDDDFQKKIDIFSGSFDLRTLCAPVEIMAAAGVDSALISKTYPLIERSYSYSSAPIEHLVGYINLVDSL